MDFIELIGSIKIGLIMKKISLSIFLISLFVSLTYADGFKKYAGEFLNLGAGGRFTAMGSAGTAMVDDASSAYWNPAGLVEARGLQFQFMHSKQFISSIQQNYLAASAELKDHSTLGISLLYLAVNGIKDSRNAYLANHFDYSLVKNFNVGDYAMFISYARPYNERINYGLSAKMIYRDYESETGLGLGFDAGLKYRYGKNLFLGILLRDITTTMLAWSTGEKEFITPSMRLGAGYKLSFDQIPITFQPAVDFNVLLENRQYASQFHLGALSVDALAGLEIAYKNVLALRLGMDDLQRFNTGIGIRIPKLTVDYSFTAYGSELGDIHRISFHLQFDKIL